MTVAHHAEPYREPAAFIAARQRTRAAMFRAATRHSRRVRIMRRAIPIGIAAGAVVLLLALWLNPVRLITGLPIDLRDVVISGSKVRMAEPRLSGITRDARAYDLSAKSAAQDVAKPDLIELTALRAKIQMHDRSHVDLSAATGLFDTKAQMLTLENDILVKSSSGYEARLTHAVVDTRTGNIVSEKPVTMNLPNGAVRANAMEIENAGEVVRLDGGVTMRLMPNQDHENGAGQGPPQ